MGTKKVLLLAVLSSSAFFAGDRLISWGIGSMLSMSHNRFVEMYSGKPEPGVLILGNSRADRHFTAPELERLLELDVTNCGIGGLSTVVSEVLLYDYVERVGKPKLLIIEPSNMIVEPNVVGDMRLFGLYSERMRNLTLDLQPKLYYTSKVFHLFRFNNDMFMRAFIGIFKREEDRRFRVTISDELLQKLKIEDESPDLKKITYSQNEQALKRMLEFADSNAIPVRIVMTPMLHFNQEVSTRNGKAWIEDLRGMVGAHKVWDYSDAFANPSLFGDRLHLNAKGLRAMNELLVRDGFFEDAELESGYSTP